MPKNVITAPELSPAIAPYSKGVKASSAFGDLVFTAGTVGSNAQGVLAGEKPGRLDMAAQSELTLDVVDHTLELLGAKPSDVLKLNNYIGDWRVADKFDSIVARRYGQIQPAISTVGHSLAQVGAIIETEAIAIPGATRQAIVLPGVGGGVFPAGVRSGRFVFLSGIAGTGPDGKIVKKGDIRAQTHQALENVRAALAQVGATPRDVIKNHTTITDWRDFDGYNELYANFFGQPYPARASILGTLGNPDALIEFDMMAIVGGDRLYVDTRRPGRYQTEAERPGVMLDPRLSPGVAPHCQAVRVEDFIAVSGMVATDLEGKLIGPGDMGAQTGAILDAIKICLERLGSNMSDVLRTLVSVTDWRNYGAYNEVYRQHFAEPFPARASIGGGLAQYGLLIEIEAWAVAGAGESGTFLVGPGYLS